MLRMLLRECCTLLVLYIPKLFTRGVTYAVCSLRCRPSFPDAPAFILQCPVWYPLIQHFHRGICFWRCPPSPFALFPVPLSGRSCDDRCLYSQVMSRMVFACPWGGGGAAILLLPWCLTAPIDFSPFTKISSRPSFAEAYPGHEDPPKPLPGPTVSGSPSVAGRGTNTFRVQAAIIFSAECEHSAMERPAALHERCCHIYLLFTTAKTPATSVMSRLGALALGQAFLRRGLPLRLWLRTCEIPRVGENYVKRSTKERGGGGDPLQTCWFPCSTTSVSCHTSCLTCLWVEGIGKGGGGVREVPQRLNRQFDE